MYHSARCLSVVRVYAFPRQKLDINEANPRLAVLLCRQVTAYEARAHDHLANLGLRCARERIAHLLLEIYVRLRRRLPAEPGETIQLPLSQGNIGHALGITHVHVSRTLQTFREQKIVRLANHRLEIINPPALIAAAGITHDLLDYQQGLGRPAPVQAASSPSDRDATGSLPGGWMPMENDRPACAGLASSSAGCAFAAQIGRHSHLHELAVS